MLLSSLRPRDNRSAINAVAVAQHSDPMKNHAMVLGRELQLEQLRRQYEDILLVLAFSGCINIGVIIWFVIRVAKEFVSF